MEQIGNLKQGDEFSFDQSADVNVVDRNDGEYTHWHRKGDEKIGV